MNGPTKNANEESLQSRQDRFQGLVEIGGVVVFIGLLIEDGPELWESILQHRLPSRGVVGGIIVAVGVGVEVLFASLVTHTSKRLQAFADARNAELSQHAANAELESAEANRRAAEANRIAEEERLARIKIEERIAGWRLDKETQTKLTEALRLWPGTPFDLYVDPAESRFMDALVSVLTAAGWVMRSTGSNTTLGGKAAIQYGIPGIVIQVAQESHRSFQVQIGALLNHLTSTAGLPVSLNIARPNTTTQNAIHILIGKRE